MTESDFAEAWPDDSPRTGNDEALVLRLESYEGPIDVLLEQARAQKVDLTRISILELADQYLGFVEQARRLRLELAADYLVMAAWLAYLKSRLLLPERDDDDPEPSGEELAAALQFQLRRLEAMRDAGGKLLAMPRLGVDRFPRGMPEDALVRRTPVYRVSLYDLLKAYGDHKRRSAGAGALQIRASRLYSPDVALKRLTRMLGGAPDWTALSAFLPSPSADPLVRRSALAATFVASLELAKSGAAELRQDGTFGPLYLRRASGPNPAAAATVEADG